MDPAELTSELIYVLNLQKERDELDGRIERARGRILEKLHTAEEGTNTVNVGKFKVSTKTPIRRKVDPELWETIRPELPEALQGVITEKSKTDLALNLKLYRALETVQPEVFTLISKCITATPGTVSLTISEIEL